MSPAKVVQTWKMGHTLASICSKAGHKLIKWDGLALKHIRDGGHIYSFRESRNNLHCP